MKKSILSVIIALLLSTSSYAAFFMPASGEPMQGRTRTVSVIETDILGDAFLDISESELKAMGISAGDTVSLSMDDTVITAPVVYRDDEVAAGETMLKIAYDILIVKVRDGSAVDTYGLTAGTEGSLSLYRKSRIPYDFREPWMDFPTLREPDYSDMADWVYYGYGENREADVFLLAPTVDSGIYGNCNMSLDDDENKEWFGYAVNKEMGLYSGECRVYAPLYRQAALSVYLLDEEEQEPYLSLAYEDVSNAFQYYLDNCNDGRPIILAGFSQGADMVQRLIEEFFGDRELRSQLVAAYAIGWAITDEDVSACSWLKMAQGEDDTGVVISFECEAEGLTSSRIVKEGVKMLSINPLNWKTDGTVADASLNLGSCFLGFDGSVQKEKSALTGAYIDEERGTLICPDLNPRDYPTLSSLFKSGEYHRFDYQLFYRNLQENVSVRLNAYQEGQHGGLRGFLESLFHW